MTISRLSPCAICAIFSRSRESYLYLGELRGTLNDDAIQRAFDRDYWRDVSGSSRSRTHQRTMTFSSADRESALGCTFSPPGRATTIESVSGSWFPHKDCLLGSEDWCSQPSGRQKRRRCLHGEPFGGSE